jgi:hypothetical protein
MADSSDNVGSWPGFVDQLNKTFMLVRDVFGYTFPGGVFFVVGLVSERVSLGQVSCLLLPYQPHGWAAFVLALWASYIMGHILITVVYLPIDLLKVYYRKHPHKLRRVPTEVIWEILKIREDHPKFLTDLDRRETMAMLAGGTGGALVIGAATFFKTWTFPGKMFVLVGVLLLMDFVTAMPHLQRVREAIIEADANTKKPEPPQAEGVKQALIALIKAATDAVGRL